MSGGFCAFSIFLCFSLTYFTVVGSFLSAFYSTCFTSSSFSFYFGLTSGDFKIAFSGYYPDSLISKHSKYYEKRSLNFLYLVRL